MELYFKENWIYKVIYTTLSILLQLKYISRLSSNFQYTPIINNLYTKCQNTLKKVNLPQPPQIFRKVHMNANGS